MYSTNERKASNSELWSISLLVVFNPLAFLMVLIGAGLFPALLLGKMFSEIGSVYGNHAAEFGRYLGWSVGCVFFLIFHSVQVRGERQHRQAAKKDYQKGVIEEIHVRNARCCELRGGELEQPTFAFELAESKILVLNGIWMYLETYYKSSGRAFGDECSSLVPDIPAAFPNSDFVVSRFPECGMVTKIEIRGEAIEPEGPFLALESHYAVVESQVIEGCFDDIRKALEDHYLGRQ